ncbi:anhydro-N-acetylmuramic acid kinase [Salinarimonas ramus]|uniref:Anhydro-N-acetylmuramic acid kinase n=1 Tax=Salinarimonas ramus TaxID=690164 RepID=A0A917Q593_9HYPH|nr:anhydro-N-acetylmuramic acid kinase [Salinarimonas ramus]GGK26673.1 anhydro-N-acetylmuramic acid kinase [Salinarimonas ramus]
MPWTLGLMTGTVLDGNVDIAALDTDGTRIHAFGPWTLAPYGVDLGDLLRRTLAEARAWNFEGPEPAVFAEAEAALTRAQSAAVNAFLAQSGIAPADVTAIGFHGQTVLHRGPVGGRRGATRQLGDGALMASLTGIDTVYDFRSADVAAGGQGAPLAPVYHAALLDTIGAGPDSAVLNLGGVANLTWRDGAGTLHAFDTGPANAPINDWVHRHNGAAMDVDGALGAQGRVDEERLARLLTHPYLAAPYPKSLDRFGFEASMADGLSLPDGAATLTAFTACAVARALDRLPARPSRIVVSGGGRRNPTLMRMIGERAGVDVVPAEAVGWRGDAVEAECFAFLAARVLAGETYSYPTTTGVPQPTRGGRVARAGG